MAITIKQSPQKFTPSNNDIIFQIESDSLNLIHFIAEIKDNTGLVISTLKLRPTPTYKKGVFFNLMRIIAAQTTVVKSDNIIEYIGDVIGYSVRLTTYANTDGFILPTGDELVIGGLFAFNAQLPVDMFSSYAYTSYVANASGVGRFLTSKPTQTDIAPVATEYLYYINDARANKIQFKFYYAAGTVVTKNVTIATSQKMGRINISPLVLEATGTDLTDLKYYTVALLDSANLIAIQPVFRNILKKPSISNVQMFWKNDLGGVDGYLFKNLRETINNTKITATGNSYKMNAAGLYSNNNANIFNPTEINLQSETTSTYTVVSEYLPTDEARWITGIISSKQVYVLLDNGKLFPVQVKDTGATIQNTRYTGQLNQFEFSFTAPSGVTGLSIQTFTSEEYFPYTLPITLL